MRTPKLNLARDFGNLKSDYAASTPSRFRRNRNGLWGSGDSHVANEFQFIRMREFVRDMDRNDFVIGQTVNRAVDNQVQQGFLFKPNTGDPALDEDLRQRWKDWADDPDACDLAGEFTFPDIEWLTTRAELVDGDIFVLPTTEGSLQVIEADRCRRPGNTTRNVVHGVLLDEYRKKLEFWFSRNQLNPYDRIYRVTDMIRVPTRDSDGNRQVFQIFNPERVSQTRGMTAFHAVFDVCGMVEDVNFATLVKQQMAACLTAFLERSDLYGQDLQLGERRTDALDDGTAAITEGLSPGQFIRGRKGEKLNLLSPNIPSNEFFAHMRFLLTVIGVNLGMPLLLVMLDSKEGNFSSLRVILDQAHLSFRRQQYRRSRQLHVPAAKWKIRQWITEDPTLARAAARTGIDIFRHTWKPPAWPYIQPLHDAQADKTRAENLLESPSQIAAENGRDFVDIVAETVRDNGHAVESAIRSAEALQKKYPNVQIHWRDILNRALPQGVTEREVVDDNGGQINGPKKPPAADNEDD